MISKIFARIRLRRGLKTDLPNPLMPSELGHCIDTQELFLGNGAINEGAPIIGNTQILTDYSDNLNIIEHIYKGNTGLTVQTGINPSTPTVRKLQQWLDDYVSIKDFGAVGDGIADDSDAFNRAITELYTKTLPLNYNGERVRKVLYFPAGVYRIVNNELKIPPNASFKGEGKNSTVIKLDSASLASYIFRTCDSLLQVGSAIGTNSAVLPSNISFQDLAFDRETYGPLARLERCSNISFKNCKFSLSWVTGNTNEGVIFTFNKLSAVITMSDFNFQGCDFTEYYDVMDLSQSIDVKNVVFRDCNFYQAFRGPWATNESDDFTFIGNKLTNLEGRGIYADSTTANIRSIGNHFKNVGITAGLNPIEFTSTTSNCSSISDTFETTNGLVLNSCNSGITHNSQGIGKFQNVSFSSRLPAITLTDNTTGGSALVLPNSAARAVFIEYVAVRGVSYRVGTINITSDGTTPYIYDTGQENAASGISFAVSIGSGNLNLLYNTTNTGSAGVLYLTYRYFNFT